MKPYAYRRWKLCYVAGRAVGWGRFWSICVAFIAMRRIDIQVTK